MSLNFLEIDKVLDELPLSGSRIQKIKQSDYYQLLLELYHPQSGNYNLLICLRTPYTRMHKTERQFPVAKPSRFIEFLKAHIKNGIILEAGQEAGERIVLFSIQSRERIIKMWVKLWGGSANIFICDEKDRILEAAFRKPLKNEIKGEIFSPENIIKNPGKTQKKYRMRDYPAGITFNEFLDQQYAQIELNESLKQKSERALSVLEKEIISNSKKMEVLGNSLIREKEKKDLRKKADLLMAFPHPEQRGLDSINLPDFFENNQLINIKLDPVLSLIQNAELLYSRAAKSDKTRKRLQEEIDEYKLRLDKVRKQKLQILENPEPGILERILKKQGNPRIKQKISAKGLSFSSGNWQIVVGRNSRENDWLLRHFAKGNDIWLHVRNYPGSHVFVRNQKGKTLPLEVLLDAAQLAVFYSGARKENNVDCYYTAVKYLRRVKEGAPGQVIPYQEKNLRIKRDPVRLKQLRETRF